MKNLRYSMKKVRESHQRGIFKGYTALMEMTTLNSLGYNGNIYKNLDKYLNSTIKFILISTFSVSYGVI